ncbi:MAG: PHP domain-containing protein [Lachnospiraceae bacterium]|nr:PHP domain-containing protein [Lachnospiraceae bacterium]
MEPILDWLNAPTSGERLENLRRALAYEPQAPQILPQYANNHIHTFYSFSPYSPTAAVWAARAAGLSTAGIMDHDSIAGAAEFREAARLAGIGSTCGVELRVSFAGTPFSNRRLNNPDQNGVAYMTLHSIRARHFDRTAAFLRPLHEKREKRNRRMTERIRQVTGIALDYDRDVLPLSRAAEGGSVTERHLLFALAGKMLPEGTRDERYRLLGKLKSGLIRDIYLPADEELLSLEEITAFAQEVDAILCYAYLGDVTDSPTGDKRAQTFEDAYLEELLTYLKSRGVPAVTYMPSRNTREQLLRLMSLCRSLGFREISGEDINSPSQSFLCPQLADPLFAHLVEAAWELVRREENG